MTLRLAVWSGPRNLSTAMMRAWENRGDTDVSDEPLYAAYLAATGLDHPGADEVIAAGERDPAVVTAGLTGPGPTGRPIWYQKHMTHHLLPGVPRGWLAAVTHAFLLRDPREVLLSYVRSRPRVEADDLGVLQQAEILAAVVAAGQDPVVIDADDFLRAPGAHLRAWCDRLGVPFTERMLAWPAGRRETDGVWGKHWYDAVWASTGFEPWRARDRTVPDAHRTVVEACMPAYEAMRARRLRV